MNNQPDLAATCPEPFKGVRRSVLISLVQAQYNRIVALEATVEQMRTVEPKELREWVEDIERQLAKAMNTNAAQAEQLKRALEQRDALVEGTGSRIRRIEALEADLAHAQ